jgi:hypothetical protein
MQPLKFLRVKRDHGNLKADRILKHDETTQHLEDQGIAGATVLAGVVRFLKEWTVEKTTYMPGDYAKFDDEKITEMLKANQVVEDPTR